MDQTSVHDVITEGNKLVICGEPVYRSEVGVLRERRNIKHSKDLIFAADLFVREVDTISNTFERRKKQRKRGRHTSTNKEAIVKRESVILGFDFFLSNITI